MQSAWQKAGMVFRAVPQAKTNFVTSALGLAADTLALFVRLRHNCVKAARGPAVT